MTSPTESVVTDTHAILWRFRDDSRLPASAHEVFDAVERNEVRLLVPTIVLAELKTLGERRMPDLNFDAMFARFTGMESVTFVPFDLAVFMEMQKLPARLEIHDRVIAATAQLYRSVVMTRDQQLQSAVRTIW